MGDGWDDFYTPDQRQAVKRPSKRAAAKSPAKKSVTKSQLVDALAERLGSRREANAAVENIIDTIVRAVHRGESVTITGFGVFEQRRRAGRVARNPRTGETVRVQPTSAPAFRPGAQFKAVVAGAQRLPVDGPAVKRGGTVKKTAAKKTAAKKTAAKKTAAKKTAAKKTAAKKAASKTAASKSAASKSAAKKAASKVGVNKAVAKKAAPKAAAKKAAAKKAAVKKAAVKKAASTVTAKKVAAKRRR